MITNFHDDKTGNKYSVGMVVWTIDADTNEKVWGKITEVGEESIVIQWEDLVDDTEYDRQKIFLRGDQLITNDRGIKEFSTNKHYGFYQLCPKCDGWGEVRLPETSAPMFGTCPVCNGAKLLVRPEIKEDKTQQP